MERIFGGNPIGVIIRLIVLSIVVGIVLTALGISPDNILYRLQLLFQRLYDLGFGTIDSLFGYFMIGALVVIPIWIISRLVRGVRNRTRSTGTKN